MLVLTRKPGEGLLIGDNIRVTISKVVGNRVKVIVEAPRSIPVRRQEVLLQIAAIDDDQTPQQQAG